MGKLAHRRLAVVLVTEGPHFGRTPKRPDISIDAVSHVFTTALAPLFIPSRRLVEVLFDLGHVDQIRSASMSFSDPRDDLFPREPRGGSILQVRMTPVELFLLPIVDGDILGVRGEVIPEVFDQPELLGGAEVEDRGRFVAHLSILSAAIGDEMSFVHHAVVGHFVRDGDFFAVTKNLDRSGGRSPIVERPIDLDILPRLVESSNAPGGIGVDLTAGPIWAEDGYLVFDLHGLREHEISFLERLVEETGCQIVELLPSRVYSVDQLTPTRRMMRAGEDNPPPG